MKKKSTMMLAGIFGALGMMGQTAHSQDDNTLARAERALLLIGDNDNTVIVSRVSDGPETFPACRERVDTYLNQFNERGVVDVPLSETYVMDRETQILTPYAELKSAASLTQKDGMDYVTLKPVSVQGGCAYHDGHENYYYIGNTKNYMPPVSFMISPHIFRGPNTPSQ